MGTLARHSILKQIQPIPFSFPNTKTKPLQVAFRIRTTAAASKKDRWTPSPSPPLVTPPRRSTSLPKSRHRLITIATASAGKWNGKCTCDYTFSLDQLSLGDLAEDGHKDSQVFITLTIEKHASFGFSVHGRIITSFGKKCINCSSSYCREIDMTFAVWVLPTSRDKRSVQIPDIGGDDPSVIYVKPGCEADLDSLIQDTIRLTTSVKETCSEICEKSEQRWQCISTKETSSSVDGRWATLVKLRKKVI